MMKLENAKGEIFYGMHFYPGVAEYAEPGSDPLRIYLNENTLRQMDPTFAGKPIFVEHVDEVNGKIDELRKEADGWVIESFFNQADGKHWVKFIVCSERGLQAVRGGMRLSNAYIPKSYEAGGLWNGVAYQKEITSGEFEHLAIVSNPRYEESVIMTPEEFKRYNEDKQIELKRLANSKPQEGETMKLNFFKKAKVENTLDIEATVVELPESKKEMTIAELVKKMDKIENAQGYCNMEHLVKVGNDEMSVGDLVKKHMDAMASMEEMKKAHEDEGKELENDESEEVTVEEGEKDVGDRGGDKSLENKEDKEEVKEEVEKKKNAIEAAKRLKKAGPHLANKIEAQVLETSTDRVARGKALFGK